MISRNRFFVSLLVIPLALAGCTSSKTPSGVSGKVTYKGQPVRSGTIAFHRTGPDQNGSFSFPLKSDGTYEGSGLLPEEMIVTVETESGNPKRPVMSYGPAGGKGDPRNEYDKVMQERGMKAAAPTDPSLYVPIPKKYADKKTSTLKATLTRGRNVKDFDLTD